MQVYYKKQHIKNGLIWLVLTLIILCVSGIPSGCYSEDSIEAPVGGGSPLFDIVIENQTDQVLTIYYEDFKVGTFGPAGHIVIKSLDLEMGRYPIKAMDEKGEIVFSEIYTFIPNDKYHLKKIEERLYKGVIPPLQDK